MKQLKVELDKGDPGNNMTSVYPCCDVSYILYEAEWALLDHATVAHVEILPTVVPPTA